MPHKSKLDAYEQSLEDQYGSLKSSKNKKELLGALNQAAKQHVLNKKPITIRLSISDLEAIKVKASKCGLPYQTYLNMIIHKDAIAP